MGQLRLSLFAFQAHETHEVVKVNVVKDSNKDSDLSSHKKKK